jgi:hypothetical protein
LEYQIGLPVSEETQTMSHLDKFEFVYVSPQAIKFGEIRVKVKKLSLQKITVLLDSFLPWWRGNFSDKNVTPTTQMFIMFSIDI